MYHLVSVLVLLFLSAPSHSDSSSCDWELNCNLGVANGGGFANNLVGDNMVSLHYTELQPTATYSSYFNTLLCHYRYQLQLNPNPNNNTVQCLDVFDSMSPEERGCVDSFGTATSDITRDLVGNFSGDFNSLISTSNLISQDRIIRFSHNIPLPNNVENCEQTATGVKCKIVGCIDIIDGEIPVEDLTSGGGDRIQPVKLNLKSKR
jgi:hypothetical protein